MEFFREYLAHQEKLDWQKLKREVQRKKPALREEMKKGLGRVKKEEKEHIDKLIDDGWDDIFEVLDKKLEQTAAPQVNLQNIEEIVQKILSLQKTASLPERKETTTAGNAAGAGTEARTPDNNTGDTPQPNQEPEELEEAEELEELEELEEAEAVEEAEELEALEEAEGPEELEEAEAVEELEEAEVPEAGVGLDERDHDEVPPEREITSEYDFAHDMKKWGNFDQERKEKAIRDVENIALLASEEARGKLRLLDTKDSSTDEVGFLEEATEKEYERYNLRIVAGGSKYNLPTFGNDMIHNGPVQGFLEVVDDKEDIDEVEELSDEEEEKMTAKEFESESENKGGQSEDQEPEVVEELEELEEIEELEEVQEDELSEIQDPQSALNQVAEKVAQATGGIDHKVNKPEKIAKGIFRYRLNEGSEGESDDAQAIVYSNGTFQLDQKSINQKPEKKDARFEELVESVLGEKGPDGSYDNGEGKESLQEIIGFGSVDLPFDFDNNKAESEPDVSEEASQDDRLFSELGFDIDKFHRRYKKGKIGILKTLMKISQRTGALYAAILANEADNWYVYDSVGFEKDRTRETVFKTMDPFYQDYLRQRQPVLFDLDRAGSKLESLVSERDKEYIRAVLFIPAKFEGREAFLYLGMKEFVEDVSSLINQLSMM